jgi:hypothetical protein
MTMKRNGMISALALLASVTASAHGQDKPGPHGGAIQMPGAFHTEVVDQRNGSFTIYLLDINFQNPSVKDASIKAYTLSANGDKQNLLCETKVDSFVCKGIKPKAGSRLLITAVREKASGNEVSYPLPIAK